MNLLSDERNARNERSVRHELIALQARMVGFTRTINRVKQDIWGWLQAAATCTALTA